MQRVHRTRAAKIRGGRRPHIVPSIKQAFMSKYCCFAFLIIKCLIFISKVIFLFVYFVKVFCRYYNQLAGQKIKFCTSNFICIFINVLLFILIQVDEFITSTLNFIQNMKNSLEGRHIRSSHAGGHAHILKVQYLIFFKILEISVVVICRPHKKN